MFINKNKNQTRNQTKAPRITINRNAWLNASVSATKAFEDHNHQAYDYFSKQARLISQGVLR